MTGMSGDDENKRAQHRRALLHNAPKPPPQGFTPNRFDRG